MKSRLYGLCLAPVLFSCLDGTVTLVGQSAAYWGGNYAQVNEASPTFHHLLAIHPLAFLAGLMVWMSVFIGIILLLPDTLALIVSIAVTFGHTVGTATWFLYRFQFGYQVCNGLFLLAAVLLGLSLRHGWGATPFVPYRPPIESALWRWTLAAVLFAAGVYLFLWPRSA